MQINRKLKITLFTILGIISTIIAVVGGYLIYVFSAYYRLDDNLTLDVTTKEGIQLNDTIATDVIYSAMSFNIGYGALTEDYSFFMDGGKESRARDENELKENIKGIANDIINSHIDILMLQEVDEDSTRTFGFNEVEDLENKLGYGNYVYAQNYDSPYLFYPITDPFGSSKSGIITATSVKIKESIRRRLPISTGFSKFLDLDRCYSISRVDVTNGKQLCIYNLHLSAYGSNASIREEQLKLLIGDIKKDLEKGNYIICGGDFNHNVREEATENEKTPDWARPFPFDVLPEQITFGYNVAKISDITSDSCRNLDTAYVKGTTLTVLLDGIIVSNNIEVEEYISLPWEFEKTDHNPIQMKFKLKNIEEEKEEKPEEKKEETKVEKKQEKKDKKKN